MAKSPTSKPKDEAVPPAMLLVVGPAKGRWRIGRHFTPEPAAIALADLSQEDIERLLTDPELTVIPAPGQIPGVTMPEEPPATV